MNNRAQKSLESTDLSVQEKKFNIDFQDGGQGDHLGFQMGIILAIFNVPYPDTSYQVSSQVTFPFGSRSSKQILKMATPAAILDFRSEQNKELLIYNKRQKDSLWKQRTHYGIENGSLGFIETLHEQ